MSVSELQPNFGGSRWCRAITPHMLQGALPRSVRMQAEVEFGEVCSTKPHLQSAVFNHILCDLRGHKLEGTLHADILGNWALPLLGMSQTRGGTNMYQQQFAY
eukprot:5527614-Amphidinium_carterae.1